jgi:hypothetical protein
MRNSMELEEPVLSCSVPFGKALLHCGALCTGESWAVCSFRGVEERTRAAQSNPWGSLGEGGEGHLNREMVTCTISKNANRVGLVQFGGGEKVVQAATRLMGGLMWFKQYVWEGPICLLRGVVEITTYNPRNTMANQLLTYPFRHQESLSLDIVGMACGEVHR